MAAGKHESKLIVVELSFVQFLDFKLALIDVAGKFFGGRIEASPPPDRVDRLKARGRNQPARGLSGMPSSGPLLHRGGKRLVHCLFCEIKIA